MKQTSARLQEQQGNAGGCKSIFTMVLCRSGGDQKQSHVWGGTNHCRDVGIGQQPKPPRAVNGVYLCRSVLWELLWSKTHKSTAAHGPRATALQLHAPEQP